ncbi:SANT/Myb-like DNA-binding domain-containing protein [Nonomuraea lactucae]|uniref:SANT/Myb-like DNA-binding domain-containing protein n=1 Tax=Nonomuraea lactucae TaxID=2249762 RepID=UPI000DE3D257|nr:SANT/Myb-like DNA-binding domain-containing protein [Nonomuraea lactucae]
MPLKIKIAAFIADGHEEVSDITMEIDRIVFNGDRINLLHNGEVQAELAIAMIRDIELVGKGPTLEQLRQKHPRAYEPWTPDEEQQLIDLYTSGSKPAAIAKQLQRQSGAIRSRLRKLGYDEPRIEPTDEALNYADNDES